MADRLDIEKRLKYAKVKTAKLEVEREVRIELEEFPKEIEDDVGFYEIRQCKLEEWDGGYIRVRQTYPDKVCTFTSKDFTKNLEDTIEIPEDLYVPLFEMGFDPQKKIRYTWGGWEIDVMEDGRVVAEFELPKDQVEVSVPDFFKIKELKRGTKKVPYPPIFKLKECSCSSDLKEHLDKGLGLFDCLYRPGSDKYDALVEEVRTLVGEGSLKVSSLEDREVLASDAGRKGIYQGKKVSLDSPTRTPSGSQKKFQVYVNSGKKNKNGEVIAQKIQWGDPKMQVRNFNDDARKSFLSRHNCSSKSDKRTPGWWACNVHKYWKQLGLSSSKPW